MSLVKNHNNKSSGQSPARKTPKKVISKGMEITAKLKYLRISPRKMRLVAHLIQGLDLIEARKQLMFSPKRGSRPLLKLLNSAAANAKNNFNLTESNLYVVRILVDAGPSLKRWLPRAMGRATPILKRVSHISLILEEREPSKIIKKFLPKIKHGQETTEKKSPLLREGPPKLEAVKKAIEAKQEIKPNKPAPPKHFGASGAAKKRFFSRQTFGNIKRIFKRRKAI